MGDEGRHGVWAKETEWSMFGLEEGAKGHSSRINWTGTPASESEDKQVF